MKEKIYKILKIIVLLFFLSEMGGLMLCTGECPNKLYESYHHRRLPMGKTATVLSLPCLGHSKQWQALTKEDVNSTGL